MISRRTLLLAAASGALVSSLSIAQQQRIYRIGYLANRPERESRVSPTTLAFVAGLQERGWFEGRNVEILIRSSSGDDSAFPRLAAALVRENVDVIVTGGAASTRAAKAATDRIPIVFGSTANPVELKLVDSLARPGGNVTGLAFLSLELGAKRLQLLKEIVEHATRVARFYSASNKYMAPANAQQTESAARALGVSLQHFAIRDLQDLRDAFAVAVRGRMDGVIVEADAIFIVNRRALAELALKYRLPLIVPDKRYIDEGALASYGENFPQMYRRAAYVVDKILRGTKPSEIPVEQPALFELAVNLKTAAAIGVTIPESVRTTADYVIR